LAHHARVILRQMEQMRSELGEHATRLRATIRLLANTAAVTEFLPGKLGAWLAKNPKIDLDLKERQSTEIARAISGGLAELGILSSAVDTGVLELRPFAIDRLVVVASRDHYLFTAQSVSFADILPLEFVGLAGGALQDHIDAQAAKAGTKLRTRIRLRTFEGVCRLVGEGVGLGIVPETAARRCRRSMAIGSVRLNDQWATRRLSICFRSEEELTLSARNLMSHLMS
jgi:DNA-binding transcriptional LysR family regulator